MSPFSFLLLCVQASLIQNVCSQCLTARIGRGYCPGFSAEYGLGCGSPLSNEFAYGPGLGLRYGLVGPAGLAAPAGIVDPTYGGPGNGNVAVARQSDIEEAGSISVAGPQPTLGGEVPAGNDGPSTENEQ